MIESRNLGKKLQRVRKLLRFFLNMLILRIFIIIPQHSRPESRTPFFFRRFPSKVFYPGRMAMTCCADDTSFLGYVCRSAYAPKLNAGDWVKIRAKVRYANLSVYGGEGPVLEAENIEPAEPIEELVYFN